MRRHAVLALGLPVVLAALAGCSGDAGSGVAAVGHEPAVAAADATTDATGAEPGDPLGSRSAPDVAAATITTAPIDGPPSVVAVVGDSLTVSARDEIEAALAARGVDIVIIDGLESRRMTGGDVRVEPGIDAVESLVVEGVTADLWVIALGTNDVGAQVGPEAFHAAATSVLDRLPPGVPVVWVDVYVRDLSEQSVAANRVLREIAATRPGMLVVDWYSNGDDVGVVIADGVHLSDPGQLRFADVIGAGIVELTDELNGS